MTKKDLRVADLPETDNSAQNSQTANAIRNQSSVKPEDYPEDNNPAEISSDSAKSL